MKKDNYKLLNVEKGTTMYLAKLDKFGINISIEEVTYDSFISIAFETNEIDIRGVSYPIKQPAFFVRFKQKEQPVFSIRVKDYHSSGINGFDTDEHVAEGEANFPYDDYYFTTSKDKLINFLINEGYYDKIKNNKELIDAAWNKINTIINN